MGLREGVSVRALLSEWQILVRPVLEYGAEIGAEQIWKQGEALQMEMGRVLGVSNLTTREVIQGDLGLESIRSRRIVLHLGFGVRL